MLSAFELSQLTFLDIYSPIFFEWISYQMLYSLNCSSHVTAVLSSVFTQIQKILPELESHW